MQLVALAEDDAWLEVTIDHDDSEHGCNILTDYQYASVYGARPIARAGPDKSLVDRESDMKSRITEEQALAQAKRLEGFQLDSDGYGYTVNSPRGLMRLRGSRLTDECFESQVLGMLNISEACRKLGPETSYALNIPIDRAFRMIAQIPVDKKYALMITKERLTEPILLACASDGLIVIDGAHRIHRLHSRRVPTVAAHCLTPELLREVRIRKFRQGVDGNWVDDDSVSERRFESVLKGSAACLARQVFALR